MGVRYIKRVNGEEYPVRYDVNAYCTFEDMSGGRSLMQISASLDMRSIRALVFAGLQSGHDFAKKEFTLSITDVGAWDDLSPIVFDQCMEVFIEQSKERRKAAAEHAKKKKANP